MADNYQEITAKMKKTCEVLSQQFDSVRAGRANPAVLDKLRVEYYGTPTPINQIAAIATPDPRSLVIQPWDAGSLKLIEKAILESDLGINPTNDGKMIRLGIPQLNQEPRTDLMKQVKKYAEDADVAIRNIRRDSMEDFKEQKKKSEITEDDLKDIEKDMLKLTDDYIKEIDNIAAKKEKELMAI
ncbi:MAG: ribosome recycling factor [Oscillospiraceae bacterium]